MDSFLVFLLLVVLTPLLIRHYRKAIHWFAEHGDALLDYLDRVDAPLAIRAVLRWGIGPLDWLSKQLGGNKAVLALLETEAKMADEEEP